MCFKHHNTKVFASRSSKLRNSYHGEITIRMHATLQVDELIKGLEDLGCVRTKGEDQTICVMSDSFDNNGLATELQTMGDLPPVTVVKVIFSRRTRV